MRRLLAVALLALVPLATHAQEQATSLGAFYDSIGVNTHLAYTNSTYANFDMTLQALEALRIHHIRDGYFPWPAGNQYYAQFQALKAGGIGLDAVVTYDPTTTASSILNFCKLATNCDALEFPNEWDDNKSATWTTDLKTIAPIIDQAAATLYIPVYGPSLTQGASYTTLGSMSCCLNYNNVHVYFGGRQPESTGWGSTDAKGHGYGSIAWWLDNAAITGGASPAVVTESGYNALGCTPPPANATYASPCAQGTDPQMTPYTLSAATDGSYLLRTLFSMWNAGVKRTYIYELFDEPSSPNMGLLFANGDSKRAYLDLQGMMQLLYDGTAPPIASENGSLTYALTGSTSNVQHTLLMGRDGCFFLVLWLNSPNVDPTTGNTVAVPSQAVTLTLATTTLQVISSFHPAVRWSTIVPAAQASSPKTYAITVSDQPTILRIR